MIKHNAIRCDACQEIVESTHRHHLKRCACGRVFVDGGHEYQRVGFMGDGGPGYTVMVKSPLGTWMAAAGDIGESTYTP